MAPCRASNSLIRVIRCTLLLQIRLSAQRLKGEPHATYYNITTHIHLNSHRFACRG